jgi:transcriptional regulator with XRE-family HTH domain
VGLTQTQLSELTGRDRSVIARWEQGLISPPVESLLACVHACGFDLPCRTRAGELKIVPEPAGSRGYDDLRRHASREPLGRGLRPQVASLGDLGRMLGALDREQELPTLLRLRRLIELDRELSRHRGLYIER